jgi:hypothetical protein
MGLLEKASAFARKKSLLSRSLELLREDAPAPVPEGAPAGEPGETVVFDLPVFSIRVENPELAAEAPPPAGPAAEAEAAPGPDAVPAAGASAASPPAVEAEAFAGELADEVSALESTIDLPSRLFGLLRNRLGIRKGALLLLDSAREVFAPWAADGYDAATLRRLRIPPGVTFLAPLLGGAPVEISDPASVADARRFFSSREWGGLDRLLLAPFAARDRLLGALIVSEISPPVAAGKPLADCLERATAAAVPALQRLRDDVLRQPRSAPASPREAREELTRFLAAHPRGTPPFTVFPLSLERCRKRVAAANPWFDPFRLEEDLRDVVSSFTADLGRAVHLGRLRFLVAVRDLGPADTGLYAHQLASLLGSLFHAIAFEPADAEVGAAQTFPVGHEATPEAAAELLASLAAS